MGSEPNSARLISVRAILRRLGDSYDTDHFHDLIYAVFRKKKGEKRNRVAERLLGKEYARFPTVPDTKRSELLVWNLLKLRALHLAPVEIITLLRDDDAKSDILERVFHAFHDFYELQHRVSGYVVQNSERLHRVLGEGRLSEAIFTDLFPETDAGTGPPLPRNVTRPSAVPLTAALHGLDRLFELEGRTDDQTTPDARAEYACRLFEFGSHGQAQTIVAEVLTAEPYHGMANYVAAMLHTAGADLLSRTAERKAFTAKITASDGDGFVSDAHEEEATQLAGAAAYHREQSLVQKLIALKHWPHKHGYFDHSRRWEQVLRETMELLALRSAGRAPGSGLGLQPLLPPHDGGTAPAPDLEGWVLEFLRSKDITRCGGEFGNRPSEGLCQLQLLWVLNPAGYEGFGVEWLNRLGSHHNRVELEGVSRSPSFFEHLRRLLPTPDDRRRLLRRLERRCHELTTFVWDAATWELLTGEMVLCYRQRALELAVAHAAERAGIKSVRRHSAIYDHVRILYDLSVAAWENGDRITAGRWLRRIADAYPTLLERLRTAGPKDYMKEIDEEYDEYEDSFGNKDDIVCGRLDSDEDGETSPLAQHVAHVLSAGEIEEADRAILKRFLSQWGQH